MGEELFPQEDFGEGRTASILRRRPTRADPLPPEPERDPEQRRRHQFIRNMRRSFLDHLLLEPKWVPTVQRFVARAERDEKTFEIFKKWAENPTKSPDGKFTIGKMPAIDAGVGREVLKSFRKAEEAELKPWKSRVREQALWGGSIGAQAKESLEDLGGEKFREEVSRLFVEPWRAPAAIKALLKSGEYKKLGRGGFKEQMRVFSKFKRSMKKWVTMFPVRAVQAIISQPEQAVEKALIRPDETTGRKISREIIQSVAGYAPYAIPGVGALALGGAGADILSMTEEAVREQISGKFGPRSEEALQFSASGAPFTPVTRSALEVLKMVQPSIPEEAIPKRWATGGDITLGAMALAPLAARGAGAVQRWRTRASINKLITVAGAAAAKRAGGKAPRRAFQGKLVAKELPAIQAALKKLSASVSDAGPMKLAINDMTKALKANKFAHVRRMAEALANPPSQAAILRKLERAIISGDTPKAHYLEASLKLGVPEPVLAELHKFAKRYAHPATIPARHAPLRVPKGIPKLKAATEATLSDWRMGRRIKGKGRIPRRIWADQYFSDLIDIPPKLIPRYHRAALVSLLEDMGVTGHKRMAFLNKVIQKGKLPAPTSLTNPQVDGILAALGKTQKDLMLRVRAEAALSLYESLPTKKLVNALVPEGKRGLIETRMKAGLVEGLKYRVQRVYGPKKAITSAQRKQLKALRAKDRLTPAQDTILKDLTAKEQLAAKQFAGPGKARQAISFATMEPMQYKLPAEMPPEVGRGMLEQVRAMQVRQAKSLARLPEAMQRDYNARVARMSPTDRLHAQFMAQSLLSKDIPVGRYRQLMSSLRKAGGDFGSVVATTADILRGHRRYVPAAKVRSAQGYYPTEAVKWNKRRLDTIAKAYQQYAAAGKIPKRLYTGRMEARLGQGKPIPLERFWSDYVRPMENWYATKPFVDWVNAQVKAMPNLAPNAASTMANWIADTLGRDSSWGAKNPLIANIADVFTALAISSELKLNLSSNFVNLTQTMYEIPLTGPETWVRSQESFIRSAKVRKRARHMVKQTAAAQHGSILTYLREIGAKSPKWKAFVRSEAINPGLFEYTETKINRAKGVWNGYNAAGNIFAPHNARLKYGRIVSDLAHFSVGRGFRPEISRIKVLRPLTLFATFPSGSIHYLWNEVLKRGASGAMMVTRGVKARNPAMISQGYQTMKPFMHYGGVVATMYATAAMARKHDMTIPDAVDRIWREGIPGVEVPALALMPGLASKGYTIRKVTQAIQAVAGRPEVKAKARARFLGQPGDPIYRRVLESELALIPGRRAISRAVPILEGELRTGEQWAKTGRRRGPVYPEETLAKAFLGMRSSRQVAEARRREKGWKIGAERRAARTTGGDQIRRAFVRMIQARDQKGKQKALRGILDGIVAMYRDGIPIITPEGDLNEKMLMGILKAALEMPEVRMIKAAPKDIRAKLMLQLYPKLRERLQIQAP